MRRTLTSKTASRPFTSLSENVAACLRNIWSVCTSYSLEYPKACLDAMRAIACTNSLSGFLSEPEIMELLEVFCWKYIEGPNAICAMCIAHCAAKSLKDTPADNGLALRYISAAHGRLSEWVWPFFKLLDQDDIDALSTAISVLPLYPLEHLVVSYVHIVEILLSNEYLQSAILPSFVDRRIIESLPRATDSSVQTHLCKCLIALVSKYDFSRSMSTIMDCLYIFSDSESELVFQFLGSLAHTGYPYALAAECGEAIKDFILDSPVHCTKRQWALANLLTNRRFDLEDTDLDRANELTSQIAFVDEQSISNYIRCLSGIASRDETCKDALYDAILAHFPSGTAKVQWTCANSISSPLPPAILDLFLHALEATEYYKVAIAVGQCIGSSLPLQQSVDEGTVSRIRSALLGQRFTLRDQYSEAHKHALTRVNALLLYILENKP